MSLLSSFLRQVREKTLFDESLLKVEKELDYSVFSEDPTSEDDIKKSLDQLINNLALDNIIPFALKVYENIALGKKLNAIHPLTTFEYFLSTASRREKIYHIYDPKRCITNLSNPYGWVFAYLKEESIKSYTYFLKIRDEKNDLICHLDDFSKKTGIDKNRLIQILDDKTNDKRYESFVKIILENNSSEAKCNFG